MAEVGLIIMSVTITRRYNEACVPGGGRYVAGIWLTYAFGFVISMIIAAQGNMGGVMLMVLAYGICYIVAGCGMSSSKKVLEAATQERTRREWLENEKRREEIKKEQDREVQKKIDAAVQAALEKQNPDSVPTEVDAAPLPNPQRVETCVVDRSGFSLICPQCGMSQRSDRKVCFKCEVKFLDP